MVPTASEQVQTSSGIAPVTGSESSLRGDRAQTSPLLVHTVALCLFALAFAWDSTIARAMHAWYNGGQLNGEVHQLIISLAQYGQPIGIVASMSLIWVFDSKRRGRILVLAAMVISAGLGADLLKFLAGRVRPMDAEFLTILRGPFESFGNARMNSFPSGHAATAFALSYGLALFFPNLRYIVWPLAVGVAWNRVLTVRHFPTDVVAGAWFGYFAAAWVSNSTTIWRWAESLNERWRRAEGIGRRLAAAAPSREALRSALTRPWLLAATCLAIYWAGNGDYGLWDRDEPRFATATREMLARGDMIVPTFNGELRPDKPVLIYWLQAIAYQLFGDGPFAARFWSGVGGMAACLLTLRLGTEVFDRRVGLVAAWMLALSPLVVIESKLGTVDAVLLALCTAMFLAIWRIYRGNASWGDKALFWSALGLGILTKGPVALAAPGVSVMAFCLARREFRWLGSLGWRWGPIVMVLIVAPWIAAVQLATDGEFLRLALGKHVVTRALEPLEHHSGFPGYYVASVMGLMAPWSFLLPWAIWTQRRCFLVDARLTFLACWAVATLVMFELVRTKLVHYYLPAYPALAIFLAGTLMERLDAPSGALLPRRTIGGSMIGLGAVLFLASAVFTTWWLPSIVGAPAMIAGAIGALGLLLAGCFFWEGKWRTGFIAQAAVGVATLLVIGQQLLPPLHRQQAVVWVGRAIREARNRGDVVALWRYRDPSLIHQARGVLPIVDAEREEPPFPKAGELAGRKGSFLVALDESQLVQLRRDPRLAVGIRDTIRRWDLATLGEKVVYLAQVSVKTNLAEAPPTNRDSHPR